MKEFCYFRHFLLHGWVGLKYLVYLYAFIFLFPEKKFSEKSLLLDLTYLICFLILSVY